MEIVAFDEELNRVAQALDEAIAHLLTAPQSSGTTTRPHPRPLTTLSL